MIVFLDIDGVLKLDWKSVKWNSGCINVLNILAKELNLHYVVTSTWRVGKSVSDIQTIFLNQGILGKVIDFTPVLCQDRGLEIKTWLDANPTSDWICIDDKIIDIKDYIDPERIYECDIVKGLTSTMGDKILKRFNK